MMRMLLWSENKRAERQNRRRLFLRSRIFDVRLGHQIGQMSLPCIVGVIPLVIGKKRLSDLAANHQGAITFLQLFKILLLGQSLLLHIGQINLRGITRRLTFHSLLRIPPLLFGELLDLLAGDGQPKPFCLSVGNLSLDELFFTSSRVKCHCISGAALKISLSGSPRKTLNSSR